ncbi:MAG: PHP domain-containing protein, partial [Verrucomicrobiae bacterium]|nr:PHP domain-containing protein [Verrucomicrobiae bacterium]
FFAAVEQAADVRLRGRPVVVGGERRGVVVSASYEARRFGIHPPMPTAHARKLCPRLIVLPGDFEKYERFSRWMFSYAYDFTPDVEICSLDEGYLDLSGVRRSPVEVATIIRDTVRQSLKITVSEGIGNNKLVSQIASKLRKPAAFECVPAGHEAEFLHPLPNRWLPGVDQPMAERLNAAGLVLIRHIATVPTAWLALLVGRSAPQLKQFANGVDDRPVIPANVPAECYFLQHCFDQDQTNETYVIAVLRKMADTLFARVRADGRSARTITVRIRYNDQAEDQAGESLNEPTDLETDVYSRLDLLVRRAWRRRVGVRAISLKLSDLYRGFPGAAFPLDRADQKRHAQRKLAGVVDQLRAEHGPAVIMRGHDLALKDGTQNADPPQNRVGCFRSSTAKNHRLPLPLVVRSYYSFLDSTLSPTAIVTWAQNHGSSAVAICDKHNLHGAVEFSFAARTAGLKPIIGAELDADGQPLWIYVENAVGYATLCRIISEPVPGAKSIPKVRQRLAEYGTNGLIGVSPDTTLAGLFPGRFYRALTSESDYRTYTPHNNAQPAVPVVPVHYEKPEDKWKFDVLQSIRTLTLLHQSHPEKLVSPHHHFYFHTGLAAVLERHPELCEHTWEIAERCNFALVPGKPQFPQFHPPDGSTPEVFLRNLVFRGLKERYGQQGAITREGAVVEPARLRQQIEEELGTIHAVGYEEYFLVVWDLLQTCRARGIDWITRGSAADSLVCYCLGISNVCPIRFELYFRRFLNLDRMALNKLPDIDIDFPHDRKDEVLDILFARYGPEHCAVVGGFSTFQARSAFAEVAKVLGVSEREVRRFTERFPYGFGGLEDAFSPPALQTGKPVRGQLKELLRTSPECADLPIDEEPYSTALEMAEFLEGIPRHPKMHPCGVVLSRQPMHELTPTFVSQKGYPTTHFDMDAVEAIGLVKLDILAQGGLAVMRDVKSALGARGVQIDLDRFTFTGGSSTPTGTNHHSVSPNTPKWQFNDPSVWDMISTGNARAVHHIESPAMISLCRMCDVRDIDTLIAVVSVIRPGAANEDKKREFARRCQGLSRPVYAHPSIEPCLRSTYGLVVYEEHILQICEAFAGLSPGRADVLRRALVRNRMDLVAQFADEFAAGA